MSLRYSFHPTGLKKLLNDLASNEIPSQTDLEALAYYYREELFSYLKSMDFSEANIFLNLILFSPHTQLYQFFRLNFKDHSPQALKPTTPSNYLGRLLSLWIEKVCLDPKSMNYITDLHDEHKPERVLSVEYDTKLSTKVREMKLDVMAGMREEKDRLEAGDYIVKAVEQRIQAELREKAAAKAKVEAKAAAEAAAQRRAEELRAKAEAEAKQAAARRAEEEKAKVEAELKAERERQAKIRAENMARLEAARQAAIAEEAKAAAKLKAELEIAAKLKAEAEYQEPYRDTAAFIKKLFANEYKGNIVELGKRPKLKETLFKCILALPAKEKHRYLASIVSDEECNNSLTQVFWVRRGIDEPSWDCGVLEQIKDSLDEMNSASGHQFRKEAERDEQEKAKRIKELTSRPHAWFNAKIATRLTEDEVLRFTREAEVELKYGVKPLDPLFQATVRREKRLEILKNHYFGNAFYPSPVSFEQKGSSSSSTSSSLSGTRVITDNDLDPWDTNEEDRKADEAIFNSLKIRK